MLREETYAEINDLDGEDLRDLRTVLIELMEGHDRSADAGEPITRSAVPIADKLDDPRRAAVALAHAALLVMVEERPARVPLRGLHDAVAARLLELIESVEEAES